MWGLLPNSKSHLILTKKKVSLANHEPGPLSGMTKWPCDILHAAQSCSIPSDELRFAYRAAILEHQLLRSHAARLAITFQCGEGKKMELFREAPCILIYLSLRPTQGLRHRGTAQAKTYISPPVCPVHHSDYTMHVFIDFSNDIITRGLWTHLSADAIARNSWQQTHPALASLLGSWPKEDVVIPLPAGP